MVRIKINCHDNSQDLENFNNFLLIGGFKISCFDKFPFELLTKDKSFFFKKASKISNYNSCDKL